MPVWQNATISAFGSSSEIRSGSSSNGINCEPSIRAISYSNFSRTSRITIGFFWSILCLRSETEIAGIAVAAATASALAFMPQNCS